MKKTVKLLACLLTLVLVMGNFSGITIAAADDRPVLRIEVFERGTPGLISNDNISTRYVQEHFGDPNGIKVEYVPVPRAQERDMLNTLMAANDAPDLCFTYYGDLVYSYAKDEGIYDLGPYIEKYPNLVSALGEDVLEYGKFAGVQYAIPAKRIDRGTLTTFIRKDWLDKLGLPVPTTTEEFYNTLVAFKEQDPGGLGDATIPFGLNYSAVDITWSSSNLLDSFKTDITDTQLATLPQFMLPGFKEGMRYLNKMYNEGLVSPNFALDQDTSQYQRDIASGKIGAFTNNFTYIYIAGYGNLAVELAKAVPGAELIPIDPFTNENGEHPKKLYDPNGILLFVPKTCKNPELVVKYLDWMTDPEVQMFLKYGIEGVHYESMENGYPTGRKTNAELPEGMLLGEVHMILNGDDFGDFEINLSAAAAAYPGYEESYKTSVRMSLVDGWSNIHLDTPVVSEATLGATVQDKGNELFVKSVTCKPEEFDKVYDGLLQEYLDIGGQEIIDEKTAIWTVQSGNAE